MGKKEEGEEEIASDRIETNDKLQKGELNEDLTQETMESLPDPLSTLFSV